MSRKTTLTAVYQDQTATRTTDIDYTWCAVVDGPRGPYIASWHRTREAALKGNLTSRQKASGMRVIAIVPVTRPA